MDANAVIFEEPGRLVVDQVSLTDPGDGDIIVDSLFSGISTGTEKLLWQGRMPEFPGMEYPLVPGYETVGEVVEVVGSSSLKQGDIVFVPGSSAYKDVRGLFGGAASRLVVSGNRVSKISQCDKQDATLLALAATAHHAITLSGAKLPELIVGGGVLGRLAARLTQALGGKEPTLWDTNPARRQTKEQLQIIDPTLDENTEYQSILDVSGDPVIIDQLAPKMAHGGEITLAGFYADRVSFAFPSVFMKEARFRVAAEWQPKDLAAVQSLIESGRLSLSGLITHQKNMEDAQVAYEMAFENSDCLKMVLNWRGSA